MLSLFVLICGEKTLKFEVKMSLNRQFEVKFEVKRAWLSEKRQSGSYTLQKSQNA